MFDSKGNINYEQLENISNGVERGDITITRLNEEEEQGRIEGGRRNVEASVIAGAKDKTGGRYGAESRYLSWEEHEKIIKPQEKILEQYAKDNNIKNLSHSTINNNPKLFDG